jgi:hypothetical protein
MLFSNVPDPFRDRWDRIIFDGPAQAIEKRLAGTLLWEKTRFVIDFKYFRWCLHISSVMRPTTREGIIIIILVTLLLASTFTTSSTNTLYS